MKQGSEVGIRVWKLDQPPSKYCDMRRPVLLKIHTARRSVEDTQGAMIRAQLKSCSMLDDFNEIYFG